MTLKIRKMTERGNWISNPHLRAPFQQKQTPFVHYIDAKMSAMLSQIIGVSTVYSPVCSGTDKKHQSSASLAFVRGIGGFPAQRAGDVENVSIRWRHHGIEMAHSFWCENLLAMKN